MQGYNIIPADNARIKDGNKSDSKPVFKMRINSEKMKSALTFPFKNLQKFVSEGNWSFRCYYCSAVIAMSTMIR